MSRAHDRGAIELLLFAATAGFGAISTLKLIGPHSPIRGAGVTGSTLHANLFTYTIAGGLMVGAIFAVILWWYHA